METKEKCAEHAWTHSFHDYGDCFYVLRKCYVCGTTEEGSGGAIKWYPMGRVELRGEAAPNPTQ